MELQKVNRYSIVEFQFSRPLSPDQEDIFISYFKNIKHNVMDRLLNSINGTDRNPIKAFIKKNLSQHATPIMMKYQALYNILQAQTRNPGPNDIFVLDNDGKEQGKWIFKMDMAAFDVSPFGDLKVPVIHRQALNLLSSKDKRIMTDLQRVVLPMMKLKSSDCRITTKFYDETQKPGEAV